MFLRTDQKPSLWHGRAPLAVGAAAGLVLAGCASPSYDELVKQAIAMQPEMRTCRVALWVDRSTGKVSRVKLVESSGDADLDRLIETRMWQTKIDPPPGAETPMPISIKLGAQRTGTSACARPASAGAVKPSTASPPHAAAATRSEARSMG